MDGHVGAFVRALPRLAIDAGFAEQLQLLRQEGVLVLEGALEAPLLAKMRGELEPFFVQAPEGEGPFFGQSTKRFGALIARAPSTQEAILHERVLGLCEQVLKADDIGPPRCDCIQLNVTQGIGIEAGAREQVVHRDQQLYWIDPGFELLVNVMYCVDDFTEENGATRFVPGSCGWARDRWPEPHEIVAADAPAGSAIIWLGSMMHGGGANRSAKLRRGFTISYSLGWLQQTEKALLSISPAVARGLPQRLQRLVGYQIHRPSLGWIDGRDPIEWLNGEMGEIGAAQDHLPAEAAEIVAGYYASTSPGAHP